MILRRLLLCLVLAAMPLATPAQDLANDAPDTESRSVEEAALDARIADRIRSFLIELDGYERVRADVHSGIVTLTGEIVDATALDRLVGLVEKVDGVVAIENEVVESTDIAERLNPVVARLQARWDQAVAAAPLVAVALVAGGLVAAGGLLLARWEKPWKRIAPNSFIADIYRQILRLVFVVLGILVALEILNATALMSTILGAAGIIGLALGFAVRDTVENFIASIMMSIRQPFSPNDVVEIEGDTGKVIRLTSRATIILSFDGNHIRLPNSTVYKSRIVNFTRNPESRFKFTIAVAAGDDLAAARHIMEDTTAGLPYTLAEPNVSVWIEEITDAGITFTVTGWIDQRETSLLRARGDALRLVKAALEAKGFTVPDTTYRVILDGAAPPVGAPRAPSTAPLPTRPVAAAEVEAQDDRALDRMIDAERADEQAPDLLNADAPKE